MTDSAESTLRTRLTAWMVPTHLHDGLVRYLLHGIRPGGYLTAVLENDLREALLRAAHPIVPSDTLALVRFLEMNAPATCWGTKEKMAAWCEPTTHRAPMPYDGPEEGWMDEELRRHP